MLCIGSVFADLLKGQLHYHEQLQSIPIVRLAGALLSFEFRLACIGIVVRYSRVFVIAACVIALD